VVYAVFMRRENAPGSPPHLRIGRVYRVSSISSSGVFIVGHKRAFDRHCFNFINKYGETVDFLSARELSRRKQARGEKSCAAARSRWS
jgi:hypothetical protein